MVAKYVVAVIMAPMADEYQNDKVASEVLGKLTAGTFKARWIISQDSRRAGVIVYAIQDTSLYVVGIAFPPDAPASGWDALLSHGLQEARNMGCKDVMFDCFGNSEFRLGIVGAAMRAGAHGRFNIGV